jgi:hypothetical protein
MKGAPGDAVAHAQERCLRDRRPDAFGGGANLIERDQRLGHRGPYARPEGGQSNTALARRSAMLFAPGEASLV